MFNQVLDGVFLAMSQQRTQASSMTVVSLSGPQSVERNGFNVRVIDGFSNPAGWACMEPTAAEYMKHDMFSLGSPSGLDDLQAILLQPRDAAASSSSLQASGSGSAAQRAGKANSLCVVIDCLSPLLLHYPTHKVLRFLEQLRTHPQMSCIITRVHEDLHEASALAGIQHQASCCVRLQPVSSLHTEVVTRHTNKTPHGRVDFRLKRRTGRVQVESMLYCLTTTGVLDLFPAPPELQRTITAEALVALKVQRQQAAAAMPAAAVGQRQAAPPAAAAGAGAQAAGAAGAPATGGDSSKTPEGSAAGGAGGMRMSLTEEERAAKARVALPYEHQGQGKAYQTGDYREYLPVAAGGLGLAESRLGHIMYVRDSDEEHDSDEDPDDDLDI